MRNEYTPEQEHTARPFRRFTPTPVPQQTDGNMIGTAPREGQARPKSNKEDEDGAKARTLESEEAPVTHVKQPQSPQQMPQALSPSSETALA